MIKNISNLGTVLTKEQQKTISGGKRICLTDSDCMNDQDCVFLPGCSVGFCGYQI